MSEIIQNTPEWWILRKTKITATDAPVIMGVNHWKTKIQLYHEKMSNAEPQERNARMQRGIDLEPAARDLFCIQTGIDVLPKVIVKDWCMASLDGISECGKHVLEIKCPGIVDHATAVAGFIPKHYYPQLQHQMYVCNVSKMYYFSFDGTDGVVVQVDRDDKYIEEMIIEEEKFYQCMVNKTPPEPSEDDYIERYDPTWLEYASQWKKLTRSIRELEKKEEELREQLISLSGESNTKGCGISLCKVRRKGHIDYGKFQD